MPHAIILVPPFVKSSSGPPLGPAMLAGASRAAGQSVDVIDLAITAVRDLADAGALTEAPGLAGDHDKNDEALRLAQERFFEPLARAVQRSTSELRRCALTWPEVARATEVLCTSPWAAAVEQRLAAQPKPLVVGVSVMFADQVLAALAVTRLARRRWGQVPLVWGGAHVAALAPEIAADAQYGVEIDGFVAGYAERTFVDLVAAIAARRPWPAEVFRAGGQAPSRARDDITIEPVFARLDSYGAPRLTLPAQATRGCSYGACTFCTYPAIEGSYRLAPALGHVPAVVAVAAPLGAVVSLKDAFLTADVLASLARAIRGRARWSGCTRVDPRLVPLMGVLAASGCETLELGVETILEATQALIRKKQPHRTLVAIVEAAAREKVRLVLNYMTGLPGEDADRAGPALDEVRALAGEHGHVVEHHVFELERRAPLARNVGGASAWPWASVIDHGTLMLPNLSGMAA